jgi:hypothetical protein
MLMFHYFKIPRPPHQDRPRSEPPTMLLPSERFLGGNDQWTHENCADIFTTSLRSSRSSILHWIRYIRYTMMALRRPPMTPDHMSAAILSANNQDELTSTDSRRATLSTAKSLCAPRASPCTLYTEPWRCIQPSSPSYSPLLNISHLLY